MSKAKYQLLHSWKSYVAMFQPVFWCVWKVQFNWQCFALTWPKDMSLMNIQTPFWNLFEFEIRLKDIIFATSQILCLPFSIMHQFRIGQKRWANFGPSDYLFYKKIIETSINEMMLVAMTFKVITNACLIYLFDSVVNHY